MSSGLVLVQELPERLTNGEDGDITLRFLIWVSGKQLQRVGQVDVGQTFLGRYLLFVVLESYYYQLFVLDKL